MMFPGLFDLAVLLYVAVGVRRGRRRGFSGELPGFLCVVLFMATGSGLLHWTSKLLREANQLTSRYVKGVGGMVIFLAAFFLMKQCKGQLRRWAERHVPEAWQGKGGMVLGGLRCLLVGIVLMVFMAHGPLRGLVGGSWIGRPVTWYVPPP
jgi:uncharacterized membrane protein required for colicin V production